MQSTIRQFEYMSIKRRVERGINNFECNCELLQDDIEAAIAAGKDPEEGNAGEKVVHARQHLQPLHSNSIQSNYIIIPASLEELSSVNSYKQK
jgi:hypothetical protein